MLQRIQEFPAFLKNRYAPCVYCYATNEALQAIPTLARDVWQAWSSVMLANQSNIRIICTFALPTLQQIENEMRNPRIVYRSNKKYEFLEKDPISLDEMEHKPVTFIRQRMFELDFLPYLNFTDIPVASFIITVGNEPLYTNLAILPQWSQRLVSVIPMTPIRLPSANLVGDLSNFYDSVVVPAIPTLIDAYEAEYKREFAKKRTALNLFFSSEQSLALLATRIKQLADVRMMMGRPNDALVLYKQLLDIASDELLIAQANLHAGVCLMQMGVMDTSTSEYICNALLKRTPLPELLALLLSDFEIRKSAGILQLIPPLNLALSKISKRREYQFVIPAIMELAASLKKHRESAETLVLAGNRYLRLKEYEYSAECLWKAWGRVRKGFELLQQYVGQQLIQVTWQGVDANMTPIISKILSSRRLHAPKILRDIIIRRPPRGAAPCGFMRPLVVKTTVKGFASTPPPGFDGVWSEKGRELFMAYNGMDFFRSFLSDEVECGIGESVVVTLFVRPGCLQFPLEDLGLLVECNSLSDAENERELEECVPKTEGDKQLVVAEGSSSQIFQKELLGEYVAVQERTVDLSVCQFVDCVFTPLKEGFIEVKGARFKWGGLQLAALFDHPPIRFRAFADVPVVNVRASMPERSMFHTGDIFELSLRLENSRIPLKHLGCDVSASGGLEVVIVEPATDYFNGSCFLRALKEDETCVVRFAVRVGRPGMHSILVMLPYWASHGPKRFAHASVSFQADDAGAPPPLVRTTCAVDAEAPPGYQPLGFLHPGFDTRQFTRIDGQRTTLDLISDGCGTDGFDVPDFCEPFRPPGLCFCYSQGGVFGFSAAEEPPAHAALLLSRTDGGYMVTLKNIGKTAVHMSRVSLLETNAAFQFIVSGMELRVVEVLQPGEEVKYSFGFISLVGKVKLRVMVASEEFLAVSEVELE